MRNCIITTVAALLCTTALQAQVDPDDRPPTPPPGATTTAPSVPALTAEEIEDLVNEAVDRRIRRERREGGLLSSDSGLSLWVGGGVKLHYGQGQAGRRAGTLQAENSSLYGLEFGRGWFYLDGSWDEQSGKSDYQLATGRLMLEADGDGARAGEAWVLFNRPLTRFHIPSVKTNAADSLLVGLAPAFWRNDNNPGQSASLLQESLAKDERLQALYTFTFRETYYFSAGIASGTRLAMDGTTDGLYRRAGTYPMLQDDRDAWWSLRSSEADVARRPDFLGGIGAVWSLKDGPRVMDPKIPFSPRHVWQHADVLHLGLWGVSGGRLAPNELALVNSAFATPDTNTTRWRLGGTADLRLGVGDHLLSLRLEGAATRDGPLKRSFGTAEAAFTWSLPETVAVVRTLTPFVRYSRMTTNTDGPAVDQTTTPGSPTATGALIAADRWAVSGGIRFGLHRHLWLVAEGVLNAERFAAPGAPAQRVDNNLWLLTLAVEF